MSLTIPYVRSASTIHRTRVCSSRSQQTVVSGCVPDAFVPRHSSLQVPLSHDDFAQSDVGGEPLPSSPRSNARRCPKR
jgi:hypothetical protein